MFFHKLSGFSRISTQHSFAGGYLTIRNVRSMAKTRPMRLSRRSEHEQKEAAPKRVPPMIRKPPIQNKKIESVSSRSVKMHSGPNKVTKPKEKLVYSEVTSEKLGRYVKGRYEGYRTVELNHPSGKMQEIKYIKLEDGDKRLGPVIMSTKSRKYREKQGLILLEGKRLITDAIKAKLELVALYFTLPELLQEIPVTDIANDVDIYKIQYKQLKIWSDVTTPPGIMGVFQQPKPFKFKGSDDITPLPVTVICDNVRDPGNMGTLIRSCAAIGCQQFIATKGCVDVWEPKVLRAGMGGHFHLPMINNVEWHMVQNYLQPDTVVFLADNRCNNQRPTQSQYHKTMTIQDHEQPHENRDRNSSVYTKSLYPASGMALVVGGETLGISDRAQELLHHFTGETVHIPMMPGMESLNSAVAGTIVLFEARRQIEEILNRDWHSGQGVTEYTS